eukprot:TRINITY_DN16_c0_g1_i5.p1 TRINITY_DN16_c0_g1~~TRINITY_DN16_c0_g1_i5.p1  ORF type:complete len:1321 (-),score=93.58 TRINITY_DN16_c0_g1_i5:3768-7640(-)
MLIYKLLINKLCYVLINREYITQCINMKNSRVLYYSCPYLFAFLLMFAPTFLCQQRPQSPTGTNLDNAVKGDEMAPLLAGGDYVILNESTLGLIWGLLALCWILSKKDRKPLWILIIGAVVTSKSAYGYNDLTKVFTNNGDDMGYGIDQASSDNYYIAGYIAISGSATNKDYLVMRIDSSLGKIWENHGNGGGWDQAATVAKSYGGNALVMGYCACSSKRQIYAAHNKGSGSLRRVIYFSEMGLETFCFVKAGSGFAGVGRTSTKATIVGFTSSPSVRWSRNFINADEFRGVVENSNGKISAVGNNGNYCAYAQYTDSGTYLNSVTDIAYGTKTYCYAIESLSGGKVIITGYTETGPAGGKDAFIMKLNLDGSEVWKKCVGYTGDEEARAVRAMSGGKLAFVGYTTSKGSGGKDAWIFLTDSSGNMLYDKTYGGTGDDELNGLYVESSGFIFAVGAITSSGTGKDVYLVRAKYCFPGTYYHTSSGTCKDCAAGTAQDQIDQGSCDLCSAGTVQSGTGKTSCTACTSGTTQPAEGKTHCDACPGGRLCSAASLGSTCPAGEYALPNAWITSCTPCPGGRACTLTGLGAICTSGTYLPPNVRSSCLTCPTGEYQELSGQTSCTSCPGSRECTAAGLGSACSDGTYAEPGTWAPTCTTCPGGYPCDAAGLGTKCSAGTYLESGVWRATCKSCADGTYQSTPGSISCLPCPGGQACSATGLGAACSDGTYIEPDTWTSTCTACPGGRTCSATGPDTVCNTGTYLEANIWRATCKDCPSGQYQDAQEQTSCTACPGSKECTKTGLGSDCTEGTYAEPNTWRSSCLNCPGGYECTAAGKGSLCLAGTYVPADTWEATCLGCDSGAYQDSSGGKGCAGCPGGRLCSADGLGASCTDGTYVLPDTWATTCAGCPGGRPCDADSLGTFCGVGTYLEPDIWRATCKDCSSGEYQDTPGKTSCIACPGSKECTKTGLGSDCTDGTYAEPNEWRPSCLNCPGGYECTATGKGSLCLAGTYVPANTWEATCLPCASGEYQDASEGKTCTGCPGGSLCSATGVGTACIDGTYVEPNTWASSCTACPGGRPCSSTGLDTPCDVGEYLEPDVWSVTCKGCSSGEYQDAQQQTSCISCPGSRVCIATGLGSNCVDGTYAEPGVWTPTCLNCPGGYLCSAAGVGTGCLEGTYLEPDIWATDCVQCDPGTANPNTESTTPTDCQPCLANTYSRYPGQDACDNCPQRSTSFPGSPLCGCSQGAYFDDSQSPEYCPGYLCTLQSYNRMLQLLQELHRNSDILHGVYKQSWD